MRIAVVCEGETDFVAFERFAGNELDGAGIEANFRWMQRPGTGATFTDPGWGGVLGWLEANPPRTRVREIFGGGNFGGQCHVAPFDALVIHLDSDVLAEPRFVDRVWRKYEIQVQNPSEPQARGAEIRRVLARAAKLGEVTQADVDRHLLAPAVESSETWCLAAFGRQLDAYEAIRGNALKNRFMASLEKSEGRQPKSRYGDTDKNVGRRKRYCTRHRRGSGRIVSSCPHFKAIVDRLVELAEQEG